jgi:hypothetical protein
VSRHFASTKPTTSKQNGTKPEIIGYTSTYWLEQREGQAFTPQSHEEPMIEQSIDAAERKQQQAQRHQQVADALRKGKPIRHAMLEAGYSHGKASLGRKGLPKGVINQLASGAERFRSIGRQFSSEARADIVRGLLVENVVLGKDRATKSAELLGKDIAVGIFKSDSTAVNVQINLPGGLEGMFGELKAPAIVDLHNEDE